MSTPPPIRSLRNCASGLIKLSHVDLPKLTWTDELEETTPEERQWEEIDRNDGWIETCHEILSILQNLEGTVSYHESIQKEEGHQPGEEYWYLGFLNKTNTTTLDVFVTSWGHLNIVAEYSLNQGHQVLYDGLTESGSVQPVDVMLEVITEELIYLTSRTGSCKVALDYWQTECVPNPISQKEWADVRGVGRQTVNDSVRSAKAAMQQNNDY